MRGETPPGQDADDFGGSEEKHFRAFSDRVRDVASGVSERLESIRWRTMRMGKKLELRPVTLDASTLGAFGLTRGQLDLAAAAVSTSAPDEQATSADWEWSARLLTPRLARSPRGLDLRLQLFALNVGEPLDPAATRCRTKPELSAALGPLERAAGLLFAWLVFPDAMGPALRLLAGAHCAAVGTRLSCQLLRASGRQAAARRLRCLRQQHKAVDAAAAGVEQLGRAAWHYGEPAGLLLLAAAAWAVVHPSSKQVAEAAAALVPVLLGYQQTARQCAQGHLRGAEAEAALHHRHKWAARRTAHLLGDLPDRPPLAGLADAWEGLCISIGVAVGGQAIAGTDWGAASSFGGFGGAAGAGGVTGAWASVSLDGVGTARSRTAQQPSRSIAGPARTAAAECPAGAATETSTSPCAAARAGEAPGLPSLLAEHGGPEHLPPAGHAGIIDSPSELHGSLSKPRHRRHKPGPLAEQQLQQPEEQQCRPVQHSNSMPGPPAMVPGGEWSGDFMHPARWAVAREAADTAAPQQQMPHVGSDASSTTSTRPSFLRSDRSDSSLCMGGGSSEGSDWEAVLPAGAAAAAPAGRLPPAPAAGLRAAAAAAAAAPLAALSPSASVSDESAFEGLLEKPHPEQAQGMEQAQQYREIAAADPPLAALYGQADHMLEAHPLTLRDVARLTLRAVHLLLLFAPFLLVGGPMLLLAARLSAAAERAARPPDAGEGGPAAQAPRAAAAAARLRRAAFRLLLWACRRSGAAFIKWGQWSSTREDVFPTAMCEALSELHDRAPTHPPAATRAIVEASLGRTLEELFLSFDERPLASGSIAQVHRATLLLEGKEVPVAVKVRHPGVAARIWTDFQLLGPLAGLTAHVPSLRGLQLKESVSQFRHTMTAQADLRVEAAHLQRFHANFARLAASVVVPRPIEGFQTEAVLVETFEPGRSVSHFIRNPQPCNTQIVANGCDTFLKMLLADNFVHTDLHPGNILCRPPTEEGGPLQIVLLDFGLAEELTPRVRRHFISFLTCISKGDGRRAAHHLLRWGRDQRCPNPAALTADMEALFAERCNVHAPAGIDLDQVLKSTLHLARKHEVTIDSNYAALVLSIVVLTGFATSLDPCVNLMDAATPCLLAYQLTGRVSRSPTLPVGRMHM